MNSIRIYILPETSSSMSKWKDILSNFWAVIIVSIIISGGFASIKAQWQTQSPIPTNMDVRGVAAPTAQIVFAASDGNSFGNSGSLHKSTDGGENWTTLNIPSGFSQPLNGIYFYNQLYGWTYGNDNYRTTDGGETWQQIPFLGSTYFMEFYTPLYGYASGNFGLMISRDGGLNWDPSPHGLFSFSFLNDLFAVAGSDSGIFRTTDGGNNFNMVMPGFVDDVLILNNNIAVAILDSAFYRSSNGGLNWQQVSPAEGKNQLFKVSENVVLASGRSGSFPDYDDRIFRSTDGGLSWSDLGEIIPVNSFAAYLSFTSITDQTIAATDGSGNMFHSPDGGLTWNQTFSAPSGMLPSFFNNSSPSFPDDTNGYYGYGNGLIIKSTNGGNSWFQISSGTGQDLNDVAKFENGTLVAVGENGTLIRKTSSSSKWVMQNFATTNSLKAIHIIDQNNCVVIDEAGSIYFSNDNGITWNLSGTAPNNFSSAQDVYFTSLVDGWILGQSFSDGGLFHTTNGGATWTVVPEILGAYSSLDVFGTTILVMRTDGVFYKSVDNGSTWNQGSLPGFPFQVSDIEFFDANTGYAVGWGGKAYRTSNGGSTWQQLPTPNENDQLTDIHLVGMNELWISTNSNSAYYTANGGQGWAVLENASNGLGYFSSIIADNSGDAWLVGYQGFIEHFAGPPPPPLNQLPTASFSYVTNGLIVNFTDQSNDIDGSIVNWNWNFGDGSFSSLQNPVHTFDTADTYIVWLKVTDDDGGVDSTLKIITVQPNPGGIFGNFTEVTPIDTVFVTPQDEDFWVITTAPADYDADGDIDIAVLGYYVIYFQSFDFRLLLLQNNGAADSTQWNFNYINIPLGNISTGSSDMAWGDADGDGDLDLAVGSDGVTAIFKNDGGSLTLSNDNLPGYWEDNSQAEFDLRSITWVDYDNDADLDLLIPSTFNDVTFSFETNLMRNDGVNQSGEFIFTKVDSVFAPTRHANSTWADFDNDQDLDLLLVNMAPLTEDGFIRRYRNDGNGSFFAEDILGALTIEHGDAQWGDYDNDGDLDILIAGNVKELNGTYNLALRIYKNNNETYEQIEVISCITCEGWFDLTAATWADYDSDGDMDILLAGNYNSGSQIEGRAKIYANDGNGNFTDSGNELPAPRASGDRGGTFSWFDLDDDGDLDYFIAGQYFVPGGNGLVEAQMHVYRNDEPAQNNAPTVPAGLNAVVQNEGNVLLSWTPSNDDHTPSIALTYSLNLYKEGLPVNIPRRLPEPGNVNSGTTWLIAGLSDGIYDWTISALDASFSESEIASGQFTIGVTSIKDENKMPTEFSLDQNYPNPFNPSTSIQYAIRDKEFVSIKVYDILGNEISSLVNDYKEPGYYSVTFNAAGIASGIYFYRIEAGNFVQTKKMTLIK